MADLLLLTEVKLACRVDGDELDIELDAIRTSASRYVLSAINKIETSDPRAKQAALTMCRLLFRPDEDKAGHQRRHLTMLIKQLQTEPTEEVAGGG